MAMKTFGLSDDPELALLYYLCIAVGVLIIIASGWKVAAYFISLR
jgi:hypothetical protein